MLTQLSNVEWNMTKSRLAAAMNEAELRNYEGLHQKVEEGIVSGRKEIENTKRDLVDAKRVRKNRMEYDALAKVGDTAHARSVDSSMSLFGGFSGDPNPPRPGHDGRHD